MIKRYRKLPVVIEAVQWDNHNLNEIEEFVGSFDFLRWEFKGNIYPINLAPDEYAMLQVYVSAEICWCNVPVGHYVIKGVRGEFYPHDPEIFSEVYREVDDYTGSEAGG